MRNLSVVFLIGLIASSKVIGTLTFVFTVQGADGA